MHHDRKGSDQTRATVLIRKYPDDQCPTLNFSIDRGFEGFWSIKPSFPTIRHSSSCFFVRPLASLRIRMRPGF
jgi:hypothetical protein